MSYNYQEIYNKIDISISDIDRKKTPDNISILSVLLILPSILAACDSNNGGSIMPTPPPDCIDISGGIEPLEAFEECPVDGITMICSNLFCDFFEPGQAPPNPPVLQPLMLPFECNKIDCFTMECTLRSTEFPDEGDVIGTGSFNIPTFLTTEDLFSGSVMVDEMNQFDYVCNSVVF